MKAKHFLTVIALLICLTAWSQGRVARVTQGIYGYSNWDSPGMSLDSCLDKTITEAHIPDSIFVNGRGYPVWEIGPGAFNGCSNLKTLYLNNRISITMRGAFHNCPNLRVLVVKNPVPINMEDAHPFYGGKFKDIFEPYHAQSLIVVVPSGSEEAYRNTPGWCNFQHIQSTMPTDEQLQECNNDQRIIQLKKQLERARTEVIRLEQELKILSEN